MSVQLLAEHHEPGLSLFVVGERASVDRPANGGLRLLRYASVDDAHDEAFMLASRMTDKHRLYRTGFAGAKLVAHTQERFEVIKPRLFDVVAGVLSDLGGTVYTGCDLNVTADDAVSLARRTPYVLAGIASPVDTSAATGHGVVGSLLAASHHRLQLGKAPVRSVLVHGIGAVGRVVATSLRDAGFAVHTTDVEPSRARVPGCVPVDVSRALRVPVDAFALCSISGLVGTKDVSMMRCELVVSGANGPFRSEDAETALRRRGVTVVPDAMSNAGAVIVDSIERYNALGWRHADPTSVYRFVRHSIATRTLAHLRASEISTAYGLDDAPCGVDYVPAFAAHPESA